MLAARQMGERQLLQDLRAFSRGSTAAEAELFLARLDPAAMPPEGALAPLEAFLLHLAAAPDLLQEIAAPQFSTFLALARQSPALDEIAYRLMQSCDLLCLDAPDRILPIFGLLAMSLDSEELAPALAACALACVGKVPERYIRRTIEAHGRYAAPASLLLLLTVLERHQPVYLQEASVLAKFAPLCASSYAEALRARVGGDLLARIASAVSAVDRFAQAVRQGDRNAALAVLGDYRGLEKVNFLNWMDGLRSLSNELRELSLPVDAILLQGMDGIARRKLAAVIFSDEKALARMRDDGLLEAPDPLNAVALNILGDNDALNRRIAQSFEGSGYAPLHLEGEDIGEVFASARAGLRDLPPAPKGPLVSVIVSAFEPDLALMRAALDSLSAQTHAELEIFVIDDASSPAAAAGTRDLVANYPMAQLIRLEVNSGPYIGRNLALARARGAYIAIHDADDWAHPQLLEAQLAVLETVPEVRLVTAEHIRIDRAGHVQLERQFSIFGDGPMTSIFRREVFDAIGPFAEVRSRGDVEMRERLRAYYGTHAIRELRLPLKLCLADSATLSQRTAANMAEYLQLWRSSISNRRPISGLRSQGLPLGPGDRIIIPRPLRAPRPEAQ